MMKSLRFNIEKSTLISLAIIFISIVFLVVSVNIFSMYTFSKTVFGNVDDYVITGIEVKLNDNSIFVINNKDDILRVYRKLNTLRLRKNISIYRKNIELDNYGQILIYTKYKNNKKVMFSITQDKYTNEINISEYNSTYCNKKYCVVSEFYNDDFMKSIVLSMSRIK